MSRVSVPLELRIQRIENIETINIDSQFDLKTEKRLRGENDGSRRFGTLTDGISVASGGIAV